ncbi:hypothetical protein LDO32_00810 [Luteimonas sp. Y-2-2-4F]|nr:hypothetical protein [Luteimonas sp. Y-2-2-4F]MCD9030276.1 hypothetical protein [Luteimonas sp. Y-2-2-4F]
MRIHLMAAPLALLLAACGEAPRAPDDDVRPVPPAPPAGEAVPPDAGEAGPPAEIVVSTNEPFFQARVEGDALVLTGVDVGERRLAVTRSEIVDGTREVSARDAAGSVEARVRAVACDDDMSGARFPMAGELIVDGRGPYLGCARPASMPPPGEPAVDMPPAATVGETLPAAYLGRWAPDEAACRQPASSIEGVVLEPRAIRFHESLGVPRTVSADEEGTLRVLFDYEGEGERWSALQVLRLVGADTLEIAGPGEQRLRRIRCAP